ncbi:MAG: hypothetical protein AABX93_02850 [Nanoarchaeota archaeon]
MTHSNNPNMNKMKGPRQLLQELSKEDRIIRVVFFPSNSQPMTVEGNVQLTSCGYSVEDNTVPVDLICYTKKNKKTHGPLEFGINLGGYQE